MNIVFCLDVADPNAQRKLNSSPYFPLYSCFTSVIESLCSNQLNPTLHKFLLVNNEAILSNFCHCYQHFLGTLRYSNAPARLSAVSSIYAHILQITEKVIWISEAEKSESQFNFNKEIFPTQFLILTDGVGSALPSLWTQHLNNIKSIAQNNEWPADIQINALLFCPFSKNKSLLNNSYLQAIGQVVSLTHGLFKIASNFQELNKTASDLCSQHLQSGLVILKWGQEEDSIIEEDAEEENEKDLLGNSIKINISQTYGYGIREDPNSIVNHYANHLKIGRQSEKEANWSWPKSINQHPIMKTQHLKLIIGSSPIKGIAVPKAFPKDVYSIKNYSYLLSFLKGYSGKELFGLEKTVSGSTSKAYWQASLESVKDKYWNSGPVGLFRIMLLGDGQP